MTEENYLMWLTRIEGIGQKKLQLLLDNFKTAMNIWTASQKSLETVRGLTEKNIYSIMQHRNEKLLHEYMLELEQKKIRFISKSNEQYPTRLKFIYDPPLGLYISGNMPSQDRIHVSIIGSRKSTEYGRRAAYNLSKELVGCNAVIVSGMARGIDSQAHQATVDANGTTIAVLGCGLDICYPPENFRLKERILEQGCVISEFPPGTRPLPSHFPIRNRIMSGLSDAVVVVEASKRSGTFITVNQALDQGREVLAVPGNITSWLSEGTNQLISEGAKIVTRGSDVLDALGIIRNYAENPTKQNALAPEEKLIYDCIGFEPVSLDSILATTNKNFSEVNYILVLLEMNGLIQKVQGQRYIRCL